MINRVTHQTVQRSTLANLQLNLDRMSGLQGKLSSGKVITKPSDDPAGTAQALQLRADKRGVEQAARNASDGAAWLTTIDSALTTSLGSLRRARDLTVQGANGAAGQQARQAIAMEIEGLRDALLSQANTTYLGRSVFAGTSGAGSAFTMTPATAGPPATPPVYAFTGGEGTVERRLAPDAVVRVDVDGSAAFGAPGSTVFEVLDRIAADLRAGGDVAQHLSAIDTRMEAMLGELAGVGTRHRQVMDAQQGIEKSLMDLKGSIAEVEDIDFAAVIVELQSQEVSYQAALGATSRVLQPSLMDFLR
ncbi:flagellar hook-associated protein 3 [Actinotalea ferrariae CF5-4]|uniref:Flagellar hook-associated protein 3 n=1 Tax=Actinotalea ferrariae CF5-4 TaxID=948458 RepID=A0A021VVB3_9CELL|nr:flagellar hook-associated protein 3 [Actinotalea ferrariae CF5-4]